MSRSVRHTLFFALILLLLLGSVGTLVLFNQPAHAFAAGNAAAGNAAAKGTPTPTPTLTSTPTPLPTPSFTPTPCTSCMGGLPKHLLTGYWQDFTNSATPLPLSAVNPYYNIVAVAFASSGSQSGQITFSIDAKLASALGGYTTAQFISDIATLHAQGRKVILSVGGAAGTVTIGDATSATNFATSAYGLMQSYGFDGVDIDLENGINVTYLTSALQQLSTLAGPNLILTLAPQTVDVASTSSPYFQLALNIKTILPIVNTQYYNSGSMYGCDGKLYAYGGVDFITAQACILLQGGLRPDQVGLGLPASTQAAGKGYVAPSVVNAALDCLATGTNCGTFIPPTTYSSIRGVMDWSINWDASNSYTFADTVGPHLSTLP